MSKRRVVVTGLGLVSPVGSELETAWENVREGRSGIGPITHFDASAFTTRIAGSVKDFDVSEYLAPKDARKMDPFMHYGIGASMKAVKDAGLEITEENGHRVGVIMGAGIGGLATIEENHDKYLASGPRRISPFFIPASIINMASGHVSMLLHITGPNLAIVTACTTSTHCIGVAARTVAYGDADVMLAGGTEATITGMTVAGFAAMKALSERNDSPETASRPFDATRDGFVMGEGAGMLVLEELEHARARGATIIAELVGFGQTADAYHITAPATGGEGAVRAMNMALRSAGATAEEVDYINAHGTSTPLGDELELGAVQRVVGNAAGKIIMSSTKSMVGHLLGAAGAVEAIFSLLAIRDNVAPPTINLDNPSVETAIDLAPHTAVKRDINIALSNSFGFGGTNASLVFRRVAS